jgi:hypothetical protein
MSMKYIVAEQFGMIQPIIFPTEMKHAETAKNLHLQPKNILGAGFCSIVGEEIQCYGESTSLGVESRGEKDSDCFNAFLIL